MEDRKLQIIKELMEQLQDEMSYGKEDFEERLGRKKPEVEIVKMKSESPGMEKLEEVVGEDLDGDHEEGESMEHKRMVLGGGDEMEMEAEGPEDDLKKRLMKLRA